MHVAMKKEVQASLSLNKSDRLEPISSTHFTSSDFESFHYVRIVLLTRDEMHLRNASLYASQVLHWS